MSYNTAKGLVVAGLALVSLAGATSSSSAADLDPGYGDAPPPAAEQKVEFGSGWYIRGDIAATPAYQVEGYQPPNSRIFYSGINSTSRAGYDLSLGGGYAMTNSFRGDIIADFHQPTSVNNPAAYCYNSSSNACSTSAKFTSYDALINGYYDFGPWGFVHPYVGAGVGVAFGNFNASLTGGGTNYGASSSYHNLAWALMAGVAFDVYDHTKIDVGYRYLDNGTVAGTHLQHHEVRAGVRYMLDD